MIYDTHMHIFDKKYDNNREEIITEAINFGVKKMIAVGYDYPSSLKAIQLAEKYDFIYAAVGLHPSEVKKYIDENTDLNLDWIYHLAQNKKVIAIGEIGLDYYWDKSFNDSQKEYFEKQIKIANELKLPIICHCRDAINDCYTILKNNICRGVLHCFSSSLEMAKEFTKLGYYIGIGGVVTFKNSKEIKRVVQEIDINYLLSETDSPYLTPHPYRGKINHPGYVTYVVEEISVIKSIDIETVKEVLAKNAFDLFGI